MTSTRVEITKPVGHVDREMDAYVQWRNECIAVRDALIQLRNGAQHALAS